MVVFLAVGVRSGFCGWAGDEAVDAVRLDRGGFFTLDLRKVGGF